MKLQLLDLETANRHHRHLNKVPRVPNISPAKPYFLAYNLGQASEDARVQMLCDAMGRNPVIVFGASGSGKTRLLMEMLQRHHGFFLVHQLTVSKNYGSSDMTGVATMIQEAIGKKRDEDGGFECRSIARFGFTCILMARAAVLNAWIKAKGPVSPEQWLWAQLHPMFLNKEDIFLKLAEVLFRECAKETLPSSIAGISRSFVGFKTVIDEAQELLTILSNTFEAESSELDQFGRHLRRSLLSPFLEAVFLRTDSSAVIAGTSLSMLETIGTAGSRIGVPSSIILFTDLPRYSTDHIKALLFELLNLDGLPEATIVEVCTWLQGRARFTTMFVEMCAAEPDLPIGVVLHRYVAWMTTARSDHGTFCFVIDKLRRDARSNLISFWNGEKKVNVSILWATFLSWVLNELHGFGATAEKKEALALVEVGLTGATRLNPGMSITKPDVLDFEALVLETARQDVDEEFIKLLMASTPGHNRASQGQLFEFLMPRLAFFCKESSALFDYHILDKRPIQSFRSSDESRPLACFEGAWRWAPLRFGRIAISEKFSGINLMTWFHRHFVEHDLILPTGFFPVTLAGPDYCGIVQRWEESETSSKVWRLCDPNLLHNWALVVIQAKFGETAVLQDAEESLDFAQFYHNQDGKVIARHADDFKQFLVELREVPVIRVVVSGRSEFGTSCRAVLHGRAGSRFTRDLVLIVSGEVHLDAAFGDGAGTFFKKKGVR